MARCKSCSAPLLANTNRCGYCGVRNDVDLQEKYDYSVHQQASERICPHCEKLLQTVQLPLDEALSIERCSDCFGLFFDLGELDTLLSYSVSGVNVINQEHLDNINADRYKKKQVVKYIKCPVCREFMHRTNFAKRSGVIVDSCRKHGVWLDSGEVTHLMEWKKAGGQLLHEREQHNKVKETKRRHIESIRRPSVERKNISLETDLLELLVNAVKKVL